MSQPSQTIKRATIGIALLVLLSKGVGFLREVIIAYRFGTGIDYDVYLIAVSVPIALYSLFGYAFTNLFIPNYGYAVSGTDKKSALRALWSDFNLSLIAAAAMTIGIILMAPAIIRMIAPGLSEQHIPEAVMIIRVSSSVVILAVIEAFFRSVLNAEKQFFIPAAGPLLANAVLIGFIVSLSGSISTRAILYGLVLGYLAQVILVSIPFLRMKIVGFFHTRLIQKHSGRFISLAVIILIIEGASQVYSITDRYFASSMDPGIISALGYANLLMMLPVAIFAYALSTAIFPYFSDAFARGDKERCSYLLTRGITVSLLLALPSTMIIWVFSKEIVLLLFHRGAFDLHSVAYTSDLLRYLAISLAGQFILWVMSRAYYAAQKYRILFVHVVVAIAKVILTAIAISYFDYIGLAISSSFSYTIGALLLLSFTGRILARVDVRGILLYVIKVMAASAVGYLVASQIHVWFVADRLGFYELLISLPPAIILSLLVVVLVGYGLNISELRELPGLIYRRSGSGVDKN